MQYICIRNDAFNERKRWFNIKEKFPFHSKDLV